MGGRGAGGNIKYSSKSKNKYDDKVTKSSTMKTKPNQMNVNS